MTVDDCRSFWIFMEKITKHDLNYTIFKCCKQTSYTWQDTWEEGTENGNELAMYATYSSHKKQHSIYMCI